MSNQDAEIVRLLGESGLSLHLVEVRTERDTGEITWARLKGPRGYFKVEAVWTVETSREAIAAQLATEAKRLLTEAG
jgi:hypothetical protein